MARGFGTGFGVGAGDRVSTAPYVTPVKFSSSFWYKIGGTPLSRFFDKGEIFLLWDNVAPQLQRLWSGGTGAWSLSTPIAAASGTWVHLVIAYDGSSTANDAVFYVNGVLGSSGRIGSPAGTINQNSSANVIGNRSAGDRTFPGAIGDAAFWSGAILNQADALALYQGTDPRQVQGRYLEDYILMRSGPPASLVKAIQPTTTGTRSLGDRSRPNEPTVFPFLNLSAPPVVDTGPLQFPQHDLSDDIGGAEDIWDDGPAGSILSREYFGEPQPAASIGIASETDVALALPSLVSQPITLVSETDEAQPLSSVVSASIGIATETDTPVALELVVSQSLAFVEETDLALPIYIAGGEIGIALETDEALPLSSVVSSSLSAVDETDTAQPLSSLVSQSITAANENNVGLTLPSLVSQSIGIAAEDNFALGIYVPGGALGALDETDSALPLSSIVSTSISFATEIDELVALVSAAESTIGLATEVEEAFPLSSTAIQGIGIASELDEALGIYIAGGSLGIAQETDAALPLSSTVSQSIGIGLEVDEAQTIYVAGGALGILNETDSALPLSSVSISTLGTALEADSAEPLSSVSISTVGLASETNSAQPLGSVSIGIISPALEVNAPFALTSTSIITVGTLLEENFAPSLFVISSEGLAVRRYYVIMSSIRSTVSVAPVRTSVNHYGRRFVA